MKHTINGMDIDIQTPDDDGIVTDIVVLARVVRHTPDGLQDQIIIDNTPNTTGIIQTGMLAVADMIINNWGEA